MSTALVAVEIENPPPTATGLADSETQPGRAPASFGPAAAPSETEP